MASCFVSVCVAAIGLDTVCDDDVLVLLDEAVSFGASGGGGSAGIISIGAGAFSVTGAVEVTGLAGLTGDTGFTGFVMLAGFDAAI